MRSSAAAAVSCHAFPRRPRPHEHNRVVHSHSSLFRAANARAGPRTSAIAFGRRQVRRLQRIVGRPMELLQFGTHPSLNEFAIEPFACIRMPRLDRVSTDQFPVRIVGLKAKCSDEVPINDEEVSPVGKQVPVLFADRPRLGKRSTPKVPVDFSSLRIEQYSEVGRIGAAQNTNGVGPPWKPSSRAMTARQCRRLMDARSDAASRSLKSSSCRVLATAWGSCRPICR
jgi:hypothetical protein